MKAIEGRENLLGSDFQRDRNECIVEGRGHGVKQQSWLENQEVESTHLDLQSQSKGSKLKAGRDLHLLKTVPFPPSGLLLPARPCPLNLPKQGHQLGTSCSNA